MIRLDKWLASQTEITRREAQKMIRQGKVTVDGTVVRQPDVKADPSVQRLEFSGQAVSYQKWIYVAMNKPPGVLCACEDARSRTVVELLPPLLKKRGLFPVGRLDKDTTGLLLLTDDGDFAHRIISPKSGIEKSYLVTLDAPVPEKLVKFFADGVVLKDGTHCKPAMLTVLPDCKARLVLSEGKYHEVKRMFGVYGLGVEALHRERIGRYLLPKTLRQGEICEISPQEVEFTANEDGPYTI